jgi:tetratricopeptide (TPR) repeat protein
MSSVSLCVIARDEADNLPACLGPLRPLVDEVVVVDTGSTDGTRAVAEALGARVFDFPWSDDFAAARNECLRHATGDWILWVDADDRIDEANVAKLAGVLAQLGDERAAYVMTCVSLGLDDRPMFETAHVRLFRSSPAHRWTGRIHEQIAPAIAAAGGELRRTDVVVHHVGYQQRDVLQRKLERNLRILDAEYETRPPDGSLFFLRGGSLFDLGRHAEAIVALHMALPLVSRDLLPRAYLLLAEAYAHEQRLGEALEQVRAGLDAVVSSPELWLLEAQILAARGELREAELSATSAMLHGRETGTFGVVDRTIPPRARHLLARIALLKRRLDDGERHARAVLAMRPAFGPALLTLAEVLLARGDRDGFESLASAMANNPEAPRGRALLAALRAMHEGDPAAALSIVNGAQALAPDCLFLKKARLSALLALDHPDAESALAEMLRVLPLDLDSRAAQRARLEESDLPDAARAVIRRYEQASWSMGSAR